MTTERRLEEPLLKPTSHVRLHPHGDLAAARQTHIPGQVVGNPIVQQLRWRSREYSLCDLHYRPLHAAT
jgi:hypothetical protein